MKTFLPILALLVVATTAGCASSNADRATRDVPLVITTPALLVASPQIGVDQIVIDRVDLVRPGFVVIRSNDNGAPGTVVSHTVMLSAGRHEKIGVSIDPVKAGASVIAVVHSDNGNVLFEFPGPDGPTLVEGKMLMGRVDLK